MQPDEMRAAGRLVTKTLAESVSRVEQVHRASATRVFAQIGPATLPVQVVHNVIATGVYAVIRGAGLVAGRATSEILGGVVAGSSVPVGSTLRSNLALAALNATIGNELADESSPLAIQMAVRHGRADIAPTREALHAAFPDATPKLAVFVHGLGGTEESWRPHADRQGSDTEATYGTRLARDLGYTPVYLRYNTGLHVFENGRHLAALLDRITTSWPVPAGELILVGHSMGGLVARSACHYAQQMGYAWPSTLRHAFYLGTPHLGAGLEHWVSRLSDVLGRLDESRPLASILDRRSTGIKDLHAGSLLEDDWLDADPGSDHRPREVPLLPGANHYAVSATVTTSRRNPLGRVVGDLLVQPASARGRSRRGREIPFPVEHRRHFGGMHHFNLLNHPAVYEAIREWLDPTHCEESEVGSSVACV